MLQWNGKDLTSEDVYFMSESFSRAARSAREMARMLLRWLVLALPIGLLCGGIGTAFHLAVEAVTELRGAHGWLLWLLPALPQAVSASARPRAIVERNTFFHCLISIPPGISRASYLGSL